MEVKSNSMNFTEGVIWKQLLIFLFPIFLSSICQQVYSFTDALIIGNYVGKEGLGAINALTHLTKFFQNIFEGLSAGAVIMIAQSWGSGDKPRIRRVTHTVITFSVVAGALIALVCIPATPFFLWFMNVPADLEPYADTYIRMYFFGMLAMCIYNMGSGVLRATGDTRSPFIYLLIACALNTVLDLLFVVVLQWDIFGAALATVIAEFVSAWLVIRALMKSKEAFRIKLKRLRMEMEPVKEMFRIGVPISIQSAVYSIANITIYATINTFGTDIIAAWGIWCKLDLIIWTLMDSYGVAGATFVAQNFGAKKPARVHESVRWSMILGVSTVGVLSAILYLFALPLSQMFIDDPAVYMVTVKLCEYCSAFYIFYVIGACLASAIRGCGCTVPPMFISMFGACALRLVWIYALHVVPGWSGNILYVAAAYPLSWVAVAVLFTAYYLWGGWRRKLRELEAVPA